MVTKFGAFYDSTLDRVGDGATFIGIGAFFLTAPDVAYRVPAVIACMVAILSSLLVSLRPGPRGRARHRLQGGDRAAGRADPAGRAVLAAGRAPGRTRWCSRASWPCSRSASVITVVQRFVYVYRHADDVKEPSRDAGAGRAARYSRERTLAVADQTARRIAPAKGKLGVLCVGLGAVATTFIAGVENIRRGAAKPIGSLTQMGTIRLGKRTEGRAPLHPGLRSAGGPEGPRLRRLGSGAGRRLRRRAATRACWTATSTSSRSPISSRPSSRCPRCSTRTTSSGSKARTSRPARPSASWPRRCGRTSATSRRSTGATGW